MADFSEVVAAGTAASLASIRSITSMSTGEVFVYRKEGEDQGPLSQILLKILKGIQRGTGKDKFGWCTTIKELKIMDY